MKTQDINTIYNVLGTFVRNGISFFSIPFFASLLGAEQYGITTVYKTWGGILAIVLGLQIDGSIGVAAVNYERNELKNYFSSTLVFGLLSSFLCVAIGYVYIEDVESILLLDRESTGLVAIQAVSTFVILFSSQAFIFLKQAQHSFLLQVLSEVTGVALSLFLVMCWFPRDRYYLACMYGTSVPACFFAFTLSVYFIHSGHWSFRWTDIRFCLPVCLPLIIHSLSGMVMGQSDRVMLQHMIGNSEAGIYSFVSLFSSALLNICISLNNSWIPFYFDDMRNGKVEKIYEKGRNYIRMYSLIVFVFLLCSPEIIKNMVPVEYWVGIDFIPILILSVYFSYLYSFPSNFQYYHMKTHYIAFATIIAAGINIGLNILVIPYYGMRGAAITTLVSSIAMFLFHEYVAQYIIPAKYHYDIQFFFPWIVYMFFVLAFYTVFQYVAIVRWCLGICFMFVLFFDLYRRRSIF